MGNAAETQFTVVQGGASEKTEKSRKKMDVPGTKEWADVKREEAKFRVREIDTVYMRLAKILYEIGETNAVDGDSRMPVYKAWWGFNSFQDYAEQELGMNYRRAYTLRKIWEILMVTLKDMDPDLRERIVGLGWTKARELVRVITLDTAEYWTNMASELSYHDLAVRVSTYLSMQESKKAQGQKDNISTAITGASFMGAEAPLPGPQTVQYATDGDTDFVSREIDADPEMDGDDLIRPDDVPSMKSSSLEASQLQKRTFAFYQGQYEIVEQALELSRELSGSDVPSHNISLICTEFVAGNTNKSRGSKTREWKLEMLAMLEKVLDLDLIAVDPKTDDFVFGGSTLARITKNEG